MKLDKKDYGIIIIGVILGMIFTEKVSQIVWILGIMYFLHKYLWNGETYEHLSDDNIEFIDKEKYYQSLKKMMIFIDIYLIIKIIIILLMDIYGYIGIEVALLIPIVTIYGDSLSRKYIKSINGEEIVRDRKFIKNKVLTAFMLVIFVGYTYTYLSNIKINSNEIKSKNYSYSLTYNDSKNKVVEVKSKDDFHQRAEFTKENISYMGKYIKYSKKYIYMNIVKEYCLVATIFMFILAIAQTNFKDRKKSSMAVNVFLILALVFLSIWSINTNDLQYNLINYFYEYVETY
ncbi:MAG: hypothetical protein Q3980_06255 [Turicibacter sp.]|nr:hypothetical protein [Turicibacter sp.]